MAQDLELSTTTLFDHDCTRLVLNFCHHANASTSRHHGLRWSGPQCDHGCQNRWVRGHLSLQFMSHFANLVCSCRTIIGIDRVESRLKLATELGCTHVIDGSKLGDKSIGDAVKEILDGVGPSITIDTTGVPALIKAGIDFTRNRGKIVQVGSAPFDFNLEINVFTFMVSGMILENLTAKSQKLTPLRQAVYRRSRGSSLPSYLRATDGAYTDSFNTPCNTQHWV